MTTEPGVQPAVRDVIIIGSGVAGYTAAIYAARAEQRPLVPEPLSLRAHLCHKRGPKDPSENPG